MSHVSSCRQALLASSLLPGLSELLDDSSCRTNVLQVLERLSLLPAGTPFRPETLHVDGSVNNVSVSACRGRGSPDAGPGSDAEAGPGGGGGGAGAAPVHARSLLQVGPSAVSGLGRCLATGTQTFRALPAGVQRGGGSLDGAQVGRQDVQLLDSCGSALNVSAGFSGPEEGKRRVCEEGVLPVLVGLLQDKDVEVQVNAAGVVMYTVVITAGPKFPS